MHPIGPPLRRRGGSVRARYPAVRSIGRTNASNGGTAALCTHNTRGEVHTLEPQHTTCCDWLVRPTPSRRTPPTAQDATATPEVLEPYLSLHLCPMPSTKHVLHTCTPRRVAARWPCCACRVRLPPLGLLSHHRLRAASDATWLPLEMAPMPRGRRAGRASARSASQLPPAQLPLDAYSLALEIWPLFGPEICEGCRSVFCATYRPFGGKAVQPKSCFGLPSACLFRAS